MRACDFAGADADEQVVVLVAPPLRVHRRARGDSIAPRFGKRPAFDFRRRRLASSSARGDRLEQRRVGAAA